MQRKLEKYQKMRDFGSTPEPSGARSSKTAEKPIFVVQKHQATRLHYDFRLEMEGVLKSWAVPKGPSYDPTIKRLAMMTEDHPYDYAAFEGVIPKGNYGAGNVIIWDNGTWELIEPPKDPVAGIRQGKLTVRLDGRKLKGEWALVQLKGRSVKGNEWLLIKHRDGWATDKIDVTEVAPRSVVSGLDLDEIGGSARQWQSNRPASSSGPRTVASALREAAAKKPRRKRAALKGERVAQASRLPSGGGRVAQASRLPLGGGNKRQKGKSATKKAATKTRRLVKKTRA